jgi:hypothetical protein
MKPAKSANSRRHAPPKAAAMIEALRGLGYNTATALADIVDNSIAAKATTIRVDFSWAFESSYIRILDDGLGMNDTELDLAMRLGEINPLTERSSGDLGRFGLGLKTATFSQCRRLSVASRRNNKTVGCLRWDLDVIAKSKDDGWYILEGIGKGAEKFFEDLKLYKHGTLVLWESLDRIITPGFTQQNYLDLIDRCERHLAMVFHRFIEGPKPQLKILINGSQVKPWNPFLPSHTATWSSPAVLIPCCGNTVGVQGYVLPHRDKLKKEVFEDAGGPDGWTAQQGFYVYRNKRLLVAGSWLGLGQKRAWAKEEAHRLARIQLDIPNSADGDWKIDIRKASARPPVSIRKQLIEIAEDVRGRARKVYAFRGKYTKSQGDPLIQAWCAEYGNGSMRYRIDREHPAVKPFLEGDTDFVSRIGAMLRVIEETVPVQRIWLDTAEGKDVLRSGFSGDPPQEVSDILNIMYRNLVLKKGVEPSLAKAQLLRTEPFQNFSKLVKSLPDNITE